MAIWGVLTCVMAVIQDFHHLVVLRVFVGVMESGFAPGILLIISSWYKREEQSKRFAVFMSAAILSGAFGGLLAGAITGGLEGAHGLRGWRWLFIVEGAATIGFALIAPFILLDFPTTSKKLSERERAIACARLQEGGVTVRDGEGNIGKRKSFMLALLDWRTWGFIIGYMVCPNAEINGVAAKIPSGHCRIIDPVLLLSYPGPRPWIYLYGAGSVYDGSNLRLRFRVHSNQRLLCR